MKRSLSLGSLFALLAIAVVLATIPGCPGTTKPPAGPPKEAGSKGKEGAEKGKEGGGDKGKSEALVVKDTDAVVKGRVVYDGDPPTPAKIKKMDEHADKEQCHAGPDTDPTW